ncbi:hypothetical protein M0M57_05925 [Flavobacterium azooxidireducens]|uniref:Gliding motility-associated protein GldM C-terminal domain-containing protein n=1 Tax=Flavobacterium azooxidireducens TaxID=1871076 RepID=A0ABY4KI59_9FLAO|nr:hypothetical protein [Flavobacterium azooxidireducens]UPQ80374.1 hypothetical protein M0M57_05925 [Flavobacterium azooxidireducens]
MKKLVFGLIAMVMFSFVGNAQDFTKEVQLENNKSELFAYNELENFELSKNNIRTKLFCITTSCCGLGPFSVQIWSQTTCYYGSVHNMTNSINGQIEEVEIIFEEKIKEKELQVTQDFLLPTLNKGEYVTIPKGTYSVIDGNKLMITPPQTQARIAVVCVTRVIKGEFFGHPYSSTVTLCFAYLTSARTSNNSTGDTLVEVDLNLSEKELAKIDDVSEFEIKEDVEIKEQGISYKLRKGKYKVNSNGKIYLNFQITK